METLITTWIYGLAMMLLGFLLLKLLTYANRDKKHVKFSLKYWFKDNGREMDIGAIMYVIVMLYFEDIMNFANDQFGIIIFHNKYFVLFLIGLFFHTILKYMRGMLGLKTWKYADGEFRKGDHVGPRPDDR